MKRWSASLTNGRMQIKATMRYHLTPVKMAIIKKSTNKKCIGCGEKATFLHHCWKCKLLQWLCKTEWKLLRKLKIDRAYDSAIAFLGIYPVKTKALVQKDTTTPMFMVALFTTTKTWKPSKCSLTYEWIKKIYIYRKC